MAYISIEYCNECGQMVDMINHRHVLCPSRKTTHTPRSLSITLTTDLLSGLDARIEELLQASNDLSEGDLTTNQHR